MRRRTRIRYMVGCTYRPLASCSSQHLPTWDEWSSPGELIHPGDWPSVSSVTSNQTKPVYGCGIRNGIRVVGRDLAAYLSRRPRGANPEAVSRPSGCRKGLRAPAPHQPLWLPGACGSKCRGTRRFAMMIVSQCFWAETRRGVTRCRSRLSCGRCWPVTFPGRVPPVACRRRCLAGYGQSRRAQGLPFGSACAGCRSGTPVATCRR
jgi:hypothetical protein